MLDKSKLNDMEKTTQFLELIHQGQLVNSLVLLVGINLFVNEKDVMGWFRGILICK